MKKFLSAALLLAAPFLWAINIHDVQVTQTASGINVSLTTEAQELYYFDSWNYSLSANVITVNAFFIEGFGSTIAYLNNNFAIPLTVFQPYTIVVRIFYTNAHHGFKALKDMFRLCFRFQRRYALPQQQGIFLRSLR